MALPQSLTRQRRELTKLWLAYKLPLIVAIVTLVLVAGLAYGFNSMQGSARKGAIDSLERSIEQATASVSAALSATLEQLDNELDVVALAEQAEAGDEEGIVAYGESLKAAVPEVTGIRLLMSDAPAPDYDANPPTTFAALAMLQQAQESGEDPLPEVLLSGQEQAHIALIRRLTREDGEATGYALIGLTPDLLQSALAEVEVEDGGYLEVLQREAKGRAAVASKGNQDARQGPAGASKRVPQSTLVAVAWSEVLGGASGAMEIPVLLAALAAALLAGVVMMALQKRTQSKKQRAELAEPSAPVAAQRDSRDVPPPSDAALPTVEVEEAAPAGAASAAPELSDSIFRAYDVRGVVDETLTEEVVRQLGQAIGSEAYQRGQQTLVVGGDGRLSTPRLVAALIEGIRASGRDVIDVGRVPTPVLYYATHYLETGSGVMVTGSHNPPQYNGFKMMLAGDTLFGDDIQSLKKRIQDQEFTSGEGNLQSMDIAADYIRRVSEDVPVALGNAFKVVVDCGNGIAGEIAPKLIRALGHDVVELFCDVDGNFPNHHPDPSQPENLSDLIAAVREQGADLGFAFDGDGDRLGVVDSDGKVIWPDSQMMLFARDVLSRNAGAQIVFDVKCSSRLSKVISKLGGKPVMYKTGHSFMKNKLKETGAPLAGEMSGHIFFKERWYGFDDALYSAARMLEILMAMNMPPAQVFAKLPSGVSTPELKIEMNEGENIDFMTSLASASQFGDGTVTTIDGVRVDWKDGWGLVRASNTTPSLVLRFEGDTQEALERVQGVFRDILLAQNPDLKLPF